MYRAFATIALIAALLFLTGTGAANAQPLIYVYPDSTYASDGDPVTLEIWISGEVDSLMGYNIAITFDDTTLQVLSVDEGTLPLTSGFDTFFFSFPTTPDSVHVNGAILGNTVDGPGMLFSITFEAHAVGGPRWTDVIIAYSEIRNSVNGQIAHDVQHGWVYVEATVAAEPASWGALKARYR